MRIGYLETFCQVVEEGNISKVAKNNFITQPAITKQIRQLETLYGTQLFERNNGNLVVTTTGKRLYEIAKQLVFDYNQSFAMIDQVKGIESSSLKIGASFTIAEYILPHVLGEFKKIHSNIDITLEVSSTPNILHRLRENKIGMALVEGEVYTDEDLIVNKFAEDELVLVCSPDHRTFALSQSVRVEDLSHEKFIWREENSGTRLLVEKMLGENWSDIINIYMELGSTQAIKGAVEINLGVAILSSLVIDTELKQNMLKKINIENVELKRDLWAVQRKERFVNKLEGEFIKFIKNYQF
ncbi:LysR family transcriptional regulator [Ornithinibacillus salinisoli]|uniref:LysR family transcriptional regulator n=1 Tax=Ornithinibacillus salinisoli TaxID=1848459 RepID=A0ABW4VY11_9BACI